MAVIDSYFRGLVESDDHLEELSEFLNGGGNPNQKVYRSATLLHIAANSDHTNEKVIEALINAGADAELTTIVGHTPLQFAVMSRNLSAFQQLIQVGAQINVQNFFGRTALHYAVGPCYPICLPIHTPDMGIIETLLDRGNIDVNPIDMEGETPLMWAVRHRHYEAIRLLLESGANPNIPNYKGQNCLHVALSTETPIHAVIFELLMNGTGIYHADNSGETPVDILLRNFRNGSPLNYLEDLLGFIAFKYRIRKDLELKVRKIPALLKYLTKARQEVEWMHKQIIYDKVTLHDFASECYEEGRRGEYIPQIYESVVDVLITGRCDVYLSDLLDHMSRRDLCIALKRIARYTYFMQYFLDIPNSPYQTNIQVFQFIQKYYKKIIIDNGSIP